MGGYLSVSVEGLDEVLDSFDAMDAQIDRASNRAMNKTAKWAARQVARAIAADDQVPLRALYLHQGRTGRHWARVRFYRADRGRGGKAAVWVGYNPIKAAYVGALRQKPKGARAGKHFFEGGFLATMRSGHRGVYRRVGKSRLPIEEQTVPLASAERHVNEVARRIPQRLADVLEQELNYEVNVRGR